MTDDETLENSMEAEGFSQAELYQDLRRIGELEDQKQSIQDEINQRTTRLQNAIPHLDKSSLLFKMLSSTLKPSPAPAVIGVERKKAAKKK
jgi:uncharacterized protein Smg (DUF494 family)